jgi:hypothetical protein
MKMPACFQLLAAALLLGAADHTTYAMDPWQVVDTYATREWPSLAADKDGNVYHAGWLGDSNRYTNSVRRGTNFGTAWGTLLSEVVMWNGSGAYGLNSLGLHGWSVNVDQQGMVFLVSGSTDQLEGPDAAHWIVRKSADHGATWRVVDDYSSGNGFATVAQYFSSDKSGHCYVLGWALTGIMQGPMVVRRSLDGGETWDAAGALPLNSILPYALLATEGAVYVAGHTFSDSRQRWYGVPEHGSRGNLAKRGQLR